MLLLYLQNNVAMETSCIEMNPDFKGAYCMGLSTMVVPFTHSDYATLIELLNSVNNV